MSKRFPETGPISPWAALPERWVAVALVLPTCHLVWTMVLSSEPVAGRVLPPVQAWIADWVIGTRVLLVLPGVFTSGLVWDAFAKEGGRRWLVVLRVLGTFVVVSVLCASAVALTPLLFPIKWLPPA